MINLELFCCSGGMAMGFRRAGIEFDIAVDFERDHCDSYERNLGHRPEHLDVRVLLEQVRRGERTLDVDLLVADPPCTPWSRAGKRLGTRDERDMLEVTCDLIAALRPRRYLIGNVPGLEDGVNLGVVHRTIGALAKQGYCVRDFLSLDAASYGVPQHRWRPFWFGHLGGPCLRAPSPTHTDPLSLATLPLPGIAALKPWVTCRDALSHLEPHELGRAVKMRRREQKGAQLGSVPDRPARVVGTSVLSDVNIIVLIVLNKRHAPADADAPAPTLGATVQAREDRIGSGSPVLEWPWTRPATTVTSRPGLAPPGHHDEDFAIMSLPDAVILSERAAAILQGFPDDGSWTFCGKTKKARWSQLGQAMPIALAEAVARSIVEQDEASRRDQAELALVAG